MNLQIHAHALLHFFIIFFLRIAGQPPITFFLLKASLAIVRYHVF